jgi:hypothetical protein
VSPTDTNEVAEVMQTLDRLHAALADLVVRGLRSAGPAQLAPLEALREEFSRIGAEHLAGRLGDLLDAIRADDRGAAAALLRAQTSSRLFERLLTREHAQELLTALLAGEEESE